MGGKTCQALEALVAEIVPADVMRVHLHLGSRDFLQDTPSLASPRTGVPLLCQQHVLRGRVRPSSPSQPPIPPINSPI
jgi:hypothetical protein